MRTDFQQSLQQLCSALRAGRIVMSEAVTQFKIEYITLVLRGNNYNQCAAARELGMHRNTLARAIADLQRQRPGLEIVQRRKNQGRVDLGGWLRSKEATNGTLRPVRQS